MASGVLPAEITVSPSGLFDPYKIYEVWYDGTGSKVIGIGFAG